MDSLIGLHIRYFDYLQLESFGRIVYVEPSNMAPDIYYVYIEDEDPVFNIHDININGEVKMYAEIRPSNEVYIDDNKYSKEEL